MTDRRIMGDILWKSKFPHIFQNVRQFPIAKNLPLDRWIYLALEKRLLTSEDYLAWAQKYYGLAVLKETFLESQFSPLLYEKFKNLFHWGPQAIPVFEWEDVLFVACVDPFSVPSNLNFICRPILASYELLNLCWGQITGINIEMPNPSEADTVIDFNPLSDPQIQNEKQQNSASATHNEDTNFEYDPPPLEMNPPSSGHRPNALLAEKKINSNFSIPEILNSRELQKNSLELIDTPLDQSNETLIDSQISIPSDINYELPDGLSIDPEVKLDVKINSFQNATLNVTTKPPVLIKTSDNSFAQTSEELIVTPPKMPPPMSPPPTISPPMPPPPPNMKAEKIDLVSPMLMELEEELKLCFAKAYQYYRNLMVLKFKDDSAIPYRWDSSYQHPKEITSIDLKNPSVFKITAKTKKPFHGPVAANPTNNDFFEKWFANHQPAYLTIIPLFFESECVGLFLGAADEELERKTSLYLMESTAHKIEASFGAKLAI